jgi:hypothetical protein
VLRQGLARAGLFAIGAIYAAVGVVAARIVFLGSRDRVAGMAGALRFLLARPHGQILVLLVVGGVAAYALWHAVEARRRKRFFVRAGHVVAALGYVALGWTGIRLLLRVRGSRGAARRGLGWLLSQPWGATALTIAGAVVVAGAISQIFQAVSGRLRDRFAARGAKGGATRLAMAIARFGLASRGIVFGIVGWFLIRTARESDPSQFREIGGALKVLSNTAAGPWLMGAVALGLIAYAAYLWTLAIAGRRR